MNLYRIKPSGFRRVGDRYSHFFDFDHFMGRNAFDEPWMSNRTTKVRNGKKYYKIDIALPGFTKKDIDVSIQHDTLSVQIMKNGYASPDGKAKVEDPVQLGQRYYPLTKNLDQDRIQVKFRDGVLKIRIPYKEGEGAEKKKIAIS